MPFSPAAVCNYNLKIAIVNLIIGMYMYCVQVVHSTSQKIPICTVYSIVYSICIVLQSWY